MANQMSFLDEMKMRYNTGGMAVKLLAINLLVFLFIAIISVFIKLFNLDASAAYLFFTTKIVSLSTDPLDLLFQPWGIFVYMFVHQGFFHFLFNMISLYFAGRMLEQYFTGNRVLSIYLLAGICGGLFEIIAHSVFPVFQAHTYVNGASGAVMGVFMALAFNDRNLEVRLFGVFPIKIIYLALIFFLVDFTGLGGNDNVARFAHVGGSLFGIYAITNPYSHKNISYIFERFLDRMTAKIKDRRRGKMKVTHRTTRNTPTGTKAGKADEFYNMDARERQAKTDAILDKIKKSGYDSLSKDDKDFLFKQSNNV
jgi:membrane associated rhomboid family serine protease